MNTYVYGEERSRHDSTIGVDFNHKIVEYQNHKFKLHIWDTAGQEKFKAIVKSYYRDLDVLFFIYDKTNSKSFLNLENWLIEVESINKKNTVKFLLRIFRVIVTKIYPTHINQWFLSLLIDYLRILWAK